MFPPPNIWVSPEGIEAGWVWGRVDDVGGSLKPPGESESG